MPPKRTDFVNIGAIEKHREDFRAHVQYRDENGSNKNICGPCRSDEDRAQKDLDRMRAAAAVGRDRAHGFEIMTMEAFKLKTEAEYAAQIRAAVLPEMPFELAPEEEEPSEEDEPWLDAFVEKPKESQEGTPASQKPDLTPVEATKELIENFRFRKSFPTDLEHLLKCRADPNAPVPEGNTSPLAHANWFALEEHRPRMRELLFSYGAIETEKDKKDWALRQRTAFYEKARLAEHFCDPREYDPMAATLERDL